MDETKQQEQELEEIEDDKKGFIEWIKEHKSQLALIGVSGAALIAMVFGLKNKDSLTKLWMSLKDEIEKGKPLSAKWLEKADLKDLEKVRDSVQKAYLNQELRRRYDSGDSQYELRRKERYDHQQRRRLVCRLYAVLHRRYLGRVRQ